MARDGRKAHLFFDEIQNFENWSAELKSLVDNASVKVVVTGSSALRIELGWDSLAGRISTVEAGVLSLTETQDHSGTVDDPRIASLPLSSFMLLR